jgi:hypothetical protein
VISLRHGEFWVICDGRGCGAELRTHVAELRGPHIIDPSGYERAVKFMHDEGWIRKEQKRKARHYCFDCAEMGVSTP